jgi:DNA-binding transcriptional regulator PaaX
MRFSELLDRLAYPAGELIRRSFERAGFGDVDELVERSPRDFLAKLAFLLNGEQEAKLFVYMVAKILEREHGVLIDADRWLEAFERGDAGFVRDWLGRLDSLLR